MRSRATCQGGVCLVNCTPGDVRCLDAVPQACVDGQWQGDMPCLDAACVLGECEGVCAPAARRCAGDTPQICDAAGQWQSQTTCAAGLCVDGSCDGQSCKGLPETCGPGKDERCCTSLLVPGGTYYRSDELTAPATVSDFRLDRFEITVGRFRAFVTAVVGGFRPPEGSGKHAHLNGGAGLHTGNGTEPGWSTGWNGELASSKAAWDQQLETITGGLAGAGKGTWTSSPGVNENRPINAVTWFEAYAFCIWDGGFLPSEAEWNYAAAGGAEQRPYPWGQGALDPSYAVYTSDTVAHPALVGSKSPKGDGKWGQADLLGNVSEWMVDGYVASYPVPCTDCAELTFVDSRVLRGFGSGDKPTNLFSNGRAWADPLWRPNAAGRCARTP